MCLLSKLELSFQTKVGQQFPKLHKVDALMIINLQSNTCLQTKSVISLQTLIIVYKLQTDLVSKQA